MYETAQRHTGVMDNMTKINSNLNVGFNSLLCHRGFSLLPRYVVDFFSLSPLRKDAFLIECFRFGEQLCCYVYLNHYGKKIQ